MSGLLREALPAEALVVAVDPGKVANRVWLATGERGLIGEALSLPTLRAGVDELERLVERSGVPGSAVDRGRGDGLVASRLDGGARASFP